MDTFRCVVEWCGYGYLHCPQLQISLHFQGHVVRSCIGCHLKSRTMVGRLHLLSVLPQGYRKIWQPCGHYVCRKFDKPYNYLILLWYFFLVFFHDSSQGHYYPCACCVHNTCCYETLLPTSCQSGAL